MIINLSLVMSAEEDQITNNSAVFLIRNPDNWCHLDFSEIDDDDEEEDENDDANIDDDNDCHDHHGQTMLIIYLFSCLFVCLFVRSTAQEGELFPADCFSNAPQAFSVANRWGPKIPDNSYFGIM